MDSLRTLLILDDDPDVARTIALVARSHGFRVDSLGQAPAFLEAAARRQPSQVAIDLVLPGMDGVEVIHALAASGCRASQWLAARG